MEFLVEARWVEAEAERRDISLSKAAIRQHLQSEGEKLGGFANFSQATGLNQLALRRRIAVDLLRRKLEAVALPELRDPSSRQVARYFERHQEDFRIPETRFLRMVVTGTKDKARRAKEAVENGLSWDAANDRFALAVAKRSPSRTIVQPSNAIPSLRTGAFEATPGVVEGPLPVKWTWWVFEVTRVRPARPQSLAKSAPVIKRLLESEAEESSLDQLKRLLRRRYRPQTTCVERYAIPDCANYSD